MDFPHWAREDGEVLANEIYKALTKKENGELSFNEILDVYDSMTFPVFRKTEGATWEILNTNVEIQRIDRRIAWLPRKLQIETGYGLLDCKKAVIQCNGDTERAKQLLDDWDKNTFGRLVTRK